MWRNPKRSPSHAGNSLDTEDRCEATRNESAVTADFILASSDLEERHENGSTASPKQMDPIYHTNEVAENVFSMNKYRLHLDMNAKKSSLRSAPPGQSTMLEPTEKV